MLCLPAVIAECPFTPRPTHSSPWVSSVGVCGHRAALPHAPPHNLPSVATPCETLNSRPPLLSSPLHKATLIGDSQSASLHLLPSCPKANPKSSTGPPSSTDSSLTLRSGQRAPTRGFPGPFHKTGAFLLRSGYRYIVPAPHRRTESRRGGEGLVLLPKACPDSPKAVR